MTERHRFTRREVNVALLATALASAAGNRTGAGCVRLFDFTIAGGHHHDLGAGLAAIRPGTTLTLVREADNPDDRDAIAVHLDALKLGYVPREANAPVATLLDRGEAIEAEVIRFLDVSSVDEIPDDLVFTAFASGDPMIRLSLVARHV